MIAHLRTNLLSPLASSSINWRLRVQVLCADSDLTASLFGNLPVMSDLYIASKFEAFHDRGKDISALATSGKIPLYENKLIWEKSLLAAPTNQIARLKTAVPDARSIGDSPS